MRVFGVSGIWTTGDSNVDRLLAWMSSRYGYATYDINQPVRNPFSARFSGDDDSMAIVKIAEPGDIVIAHSYGCLKTAYAMREVEFSKVFMFRPAMPRKWKFPDNATEVHCIHSRGDWAILAGAMMRFGHPFGLAGRVGFKDKQVVNLKTHGGHNADFDDKLQYWGAYIHNLIKKPIGG